MVLTRSNRKLLESEPRSPKADLADLTISADNFSRSQRSKANVQTSVFEEKGIHGYETPVKNFQQSTPAGVFGRASAQVPPNCDEDRHLGRDSEESPSVFSIDDDDVIGSVTKNHSSKRSWPALERLIEQMVETAHAKRAYYASKATHAEEHSMVDCMAVLVRMDVSGEQYGRAAEKLVESKDWRTFFLLSPPDKQLAWINYLK
ncbi:hypothetical protein LguiA_029623 [Lonicera macranthoides]